MPEGGCFCGACRYSFTGETEFKVCTYLAIASSQDFRDTDINLRSGCLPLHRLPQDKR